MKWNMVLSVEKVRDFHTNSFGGSSPVVQKPAGGRTTKGFVAGCAKALKVPSDCMCNF